MTDNYRDEMREALAGLIAGMDAGTFEACCIADDEEELQAKVDATDDLWTNARAALSRLSAQGDEYHTMDDLYAHRFALTRALAVLMPDACVKCRVNGDGTVWEGFFVVYIQTPAGQVSYHYRLDLWDKLPCREVESWTYDGHTPETTLDRLMSIQPSPAPDAAALRARVLVACIETESALARHEVEHGDGWLYNHADVIRGYKTELEALLRSEPRGEEGRG